VQDLAIGEQQRLEIVKALFRGARILILDEPTAALTPQETEGLFQAVRAMAKRGLTVIFISHKLEEVRAITTHVLVMRQGRVVAELANAPELSSRRIAELMCGRPIQAPVKGSFYIRAQCSCACAMSARAEASGGDSNQFRWRCGLERSSASPESRAMASVSSPM
jgi:ABC-type uncharacterized transport system ATPase subunit